MKAYLLTTASLFAVLALVHFVGSIAQAQKFAQEPWFWLQGPGLGVVAAGFAFWGFRSFVRSQGR